MKNVHPCTFFIDEFETSPQTSLLHGISGIRAAAEKPIALCTNQTGQYYLFRTFSLSIALRKRNNSAASKCENFCVAEFIRMLFYAVIKLSPLPKNLLQQEKTVFIQNYVLEPRRVLRGDLGEELLLILKEETCGKTASGVPFLGFLFKPKGIYKLLTNITFRNG